MKLLYLRIVLSGLFVMLLFGNSQAQGVIDRDHIVQFSGKVVSEDDGELVGVPFVTIYIKSNPNRGVYSDGEGFFSIIALKGETVVFSSIQHENAEFVVPDTLTEDRYSIFQILTKDTINLPAVEIYPWPSRKHFEIEFLALDVTEELRDNAEKNLATESLMRASEQTPADGDETADLYFKQQQEQIYSAGQFKPNNILNPLAWQKFIKAWKDGDFKNKKN